MTGAGLQAGPAALQVLPADEHNRRLVEAVHPPDWVNPVPARRYNLVVLGAGTAGLVSAAGAAGLGARVALVEHQLMGGDCLNVGCVPSKALLRSARAVADVADAVRFGVELQGEARADFGAVMERLRGLRAGLAPHDSAERFRALGVDVFLGQGRFTGRDTLEVGGARLRFRRAVIATGARAAAPAIPGLPDAGYLTNETVFGLTALPRRLAVIGGGPIGCELAQAFARLGSHVTLIERGTQLLGREDEDAARVVQRALEHDGVELLFRAQTMLVARERDERLLALHVEDKPRELRVDAILVGVGRAPNVEGLGLEAAGVAFDSRRGVQVDDRLRTANPAIFAAGDVCSRFQFTHAADAMARIVIQNALFLGRRRASALTIPWCTYTDPEVAHVGLLARDAAQSGRAIHTFTQPLAEVDRAVLDGETDGFARVHVAAGSGRLLGATVVARHAGEMLSELTAALAAGKGLGSLAATIHPYPTQADAIRRLGDQWNRTRLTPRVAGLLRRWLALTR